ncbi:polymeric immunoglobulin receptor-like [Sebastes fasciatus]|uniref:polymeric immunoglobulin receptor-like n=1 Tax=Sebastes fasciatus TaxID=394691 RepID=UPI003D9EC1A4
MTVHLSFLLIITGLTGIHSLTVSKVSVKAGDSISIPCLYDSQYMNHVKYLCKGYFWSSCSDAVKTNQQNSGKFSISDDKSRGIFTVTIKDLTDKDTDYWCKVEIDGGLDVGEYFQLSVTGGTPSLYVDHQEITGFKGGNITINCHYHNSGEMKWCRLGSSCVTTSSGSINGTRVTISMSVPDVFTVTMSGLRTESSGWYWCAKGDLQVPVHVTVTEQSTTRIHSMTTVSEVSVKAGDSVTIPCLYDSQHMNHVKYLCKGYYRKYCSYAVKTNQQNSEKFSISDDKEQRTFTVTIKDLTDEDTHFWCAVEIDEESDFHKYFHLSVTRGTPSLYVDHQEITGFEGGNITINCHYINYGEIKWCRLGSSCVTMSSGPIDGTRVTTNASVPNVFTVTMSGLRTESSGWYWCAIGSLQMPVHLTVTERPANTTLTATSHLTTLSSTPEPVNVTTVFEKPATITATGLTPVSPTLEPVNLTPAPTAQGGHPSLSEHLKIFGIRLSVLVLVVMVTLFICFMIKRHMQTRAESSDTTTAEEEVRYVRTTSDERSDAESDVDGI